MAEVKSKIPRIVELADRLTEDIQSRDLQPGDRYLTARDASKLLGVSCVDVNSALQLLEKRSVITRRQGKGAFIAEGSASSGHVSSLRRVHLLVHKGYYKTEGVANDGVLIGMQGELPQSSASINFLPVDGETEFVDSLVADSLKNDEKDGFVLYRASLETQRHIAASGLPTVVVGSLYPSVSGVPNLDRDSTSIGRILTEYLLEQGMRRVVFLTRQHVLPGDYETFDAIHGVLSQAGLVGSFLMRSLPADVEASEALVDGLLRESPLPTGFVCRNAVLARGAAKAYASRLGQAQVIKGIAVCDYWLKSGESPEFAYPRPTLTPVEQGQHIGRMLAQQALGESPDPLCQRVPVELAVPGE